MRGHMNKKIFSMILCIIITTLLSQCKKTTNAEIIYTISIDVVTLDPAYANDIESSKVLCNIYEGLTKYKDYSTEIIPCLAKSWEISSDGLEYIFKLRDDVYFHDGSKFNAQAVKYSIERQTIDGTDAMEYRNFTFGMIDKIEIIDEFQIKISLKYKYTPFLANLAMPIASQIVSPDAAKKYGKAFSENPSGTGPFRLTKWEKDKELIIIRNDNYWGESAIIHKVTYKIEKDPKKRITDLLEKKTDIIDSLSAEESDLLLKNGLKIFKSKGMNVSCISFNCSKPPFNNRAAREAVIMSIDRKSLINRLYGDYADLANSPLPDFMPGYNPDSQPKEYNPQKASQLIKETGLDKITLELYAVPGAKPYNPAGGEFLGKEITSILENNGIKVNFSVLNRVQVSDKYKNNSWDFRIYGWIGDNGDPDNFLFLFETSEIKSNLNTARYSNPIVDAKLALARSLPNGEERYNLYKEIQKILSEDSPWLPISHGTDKAALYPEIKNLSIHPIGIVFFQKVRKE